MVCNGTVPPVRYLKWSLIVIVVETHVPFLWAMYCKYLQVRLQCSRVPCHVNTCNPCEARKCAKQVTKLYQNIILA